MTVIFGPSFFRLPRALNPIDPTAPFQAPTGPPPAPLTGFRQPGRHPEDSSGRREARQRPPGLPVPPGVIRPGVRPPPALGGPEGGDTGQGGGASPGHF